MYVTFCKQCHDIVVLRSVRLDNVPTEEQDFTTTDRLNLIGAVIFTCEPILDVIGVYCSTWIRTLRVVVSAGMEFKTIPTTTFHITSPPPRLPSLSQNTLAR